MRHVLNRTGLFVQVAVLGLLVTTVCTFGWGIARTVELIGNLVDGGFADDKLLIDLLKVIDTYLIAVVQLIFVIGLYELFVGDLDLPAWLEVNSLDDLKKSLIDSLIVVLAVKGVELVFSADEPLDALYSAAAIAVLVVAFTGFRSTKSSTRTPATVAPAQPSDPHRQRQP